MENKTKKCKQCQTDIPALAKKCPNCQSDLRSWFVRHPILTGLAGLVIIVTVLSAIGGNSDNKTYTENKEGAESVKNEENIKTEATWYKVDSWSGTGIKKTEPFTITGEQWRVNWKNKGGELGGGILQIFVYKPGEKMMEELFGNTTEITSDTSYVYKNGTFYLEINSANTSWEIEIEELR